MVSLLGLYGGGRGCRINAKSGGAGGGTGRAAAWRAPAPVRQLFWRVRSRLRNAVLPRPATRRRAVSFGYDLRSYCHNFDDGGLVSGHRF